MLENAIYINDGHRSDGTVVDFAHAILNRVKTGETRTHKSLTRKWVGIVWHGMVIGRIRLGEPQPLNRNSAEYAGALIEGTEFDLREGEIRYYYPVLEVEDFGNKPRPVLRHGNYAQYER